MRYFKAYQMYGLILLIILVNACGMFFPILRNDDSALYANIVKNMLQNHDWINLVHYRVEWLDKPHFPFWLTGMSFYVFGINSFAYILPGFLFNLIGAYYTYLLAKKLYNVDVGEIAAVVYLSSFHLMLSAIDVRAEAYLLGAIIPACYYWYLYNKTLEINLKYLLLGSVWTGLAIMTKGLFVLVTITSGLITLWIYNKQLTNFFRLKWLLALALSFVFITPELIALYIQFDLHPEKIIYGQTDVSGLKWFFWDSQFGRFFNSGPVVHTGNDGLDHYWFFIHTFLWSFLPWSLVFIAAIISSIKTLRTKSSNILNEKANIYYLYGSFIPTFILFSLTKFQLDYYTNILIPFAAILCASWFFNMRMLASNHEARSNFVFRFQTWLSVVLVMATIALSILIFGRQWILLIGLVGGIMLILFIVFIHRDELVKAILYPALAISLVFIFVMLIYGRVYAKYDAGYQAAKYLNGKQALMVADYKVYSLPLEFHTKYNHYQVTGVDDLKELNAKNKSYYIFIYAKDLPLIKQELSEQNIQVLYTISGATIDVVMINLLSKPRLKSKVQKYLVLMVN
jgi:4-amino-4-deoxy-L-arabinose transferase-like glycosyltransferase